MAGATHSSQSFTPELRRRVPIGAEYAGDGHSHVRVWAPNAARLQVIVNERDPQPLTAESDGYFSDAIVAEPGDRYQLLINDDEKRYPDPASRFQPEGPHGPSEIVDPTSFAWTDDHLRGVPLAESAMPDPDSASHRH